MAIRSRSPPLPFKPTAQNTKYRDRSGEEGDGGESGDELDTRTAAAADSGSGSGSGGRTDKAVAAAVSTDSKHYGGGGKSGKKSKHKQTGPAAAAAAAAGELRRRSVSNSDATPPPNSNRNASHQPRKAKHQRQNPAPPTASGESDDTEPGASPALRPAQSFDAARAAADRKHSALPHSNPHVSHAHSEPGGTPHVAGSGVGTATPPSAAASGLGAHVSSTREKRAKHAKNAFSTYPPVGALSDEVSSTEPPTESEVDDLAAQLQGMSIEDVRQLAMAYKALAARHNQSTAQLKPAQVLAEYTTASAASAAAAVASPTATVNPNPPTASNAVSPNSAASK